MSITSFFKKTTDTNFNNVNNVNSHSKLTNVNNVNSNDQSVTSVNSSASSGLSCQYRPPKSFIFPKTTFGNRERRCQHQWFEDYNWLHYDEKKDCVFCYICMKHHKKMSAEHNKDLAYISNGFKSWKKAPKCFSDHEKTKCHAAALTYEVTVPKCQDVSEMTSTIVQQQREKERHYLKMIMESLQYLERQGIPLRGKEDGNDNFTQLLLLRGKDHPYIAERLTSKKEHGTLYVYHTYQNDIL